MTPKQWERVKELFDEALELDPVQRTPVLERAEREGAEVREEIERLLVDHDSLAAEPAPFILDDIQVPPIATLSRNFAADDMVAGRYRIIRFLAKGGMGEVYEAHDEELDERVALKALREELTLDQRSLERFKHEVTLAKRVTHPNVCRIHDLGRHRLSAEGEESAEQEEIVFLTMELLAGPTLSDHLKDNGKMSPSEALPLVRQMAKALAALHEASVVHRDFKPGNVMLAPAADGQTRVVVTDLGLARSTAPNVDEENRLSTQSLLICTPDYVAPEQLTGAPVNPATDVYALGLVLYEMISGERPFASPTPLGSIVKRVTTPPRPLKDLVPELDPRWEASIVRCLEREADKRFSSPLDVVRALEGKAPVYEEADEAARTFPWARAAAVFGAVVAVSVGLWLFSFVRDPLLDRACQWFPGRSWACQLPDDKDLAVFRFENSSADPQDRAFADGLIAHISSGLYRLAPDKESMCVHVRSDRNAFGVKLVLGGEIERSGGQVRIHATIRRVEDNHLLREEEWIVPTEDASILHAGLLRDLAGSLELDISAEHWAAWESEGTDNGQAFGAYLRGLGYLQAENHEAAAGAFNEATEQEFPFALAHAGLGEACRLLESKDGDPNWAKRARNAYQVAQGLSEKIPQTFFGLGQLEISLKKYRDAVSLLERALELEPYDFNIRRKLAVAYEAMGDAEAAENANVETAALRGECWYNFNHLGQFYLYRGRFREAEQHFLRVVQLADDNAVAHANLSFLYLKLGRFPDAVRHGREGAQGGVSIARMNVGRALFFRLVSGICG